MNKKIMAALIPLVCVSSAAHAGWFSESFEECINKAARMPTPAGVNLAGSNCYGKESKKPEKPKMIKTCSGKQIEDKGYGNFQIEDMHNYGDVNLIEMGYQNGVRFARAQSTIGVPLSMVFLDEYETKTSSRPRATYRCDASNTTYGISPNVSGKFFCNDMPARHGWYRINSVATAYVEHKTLRAAEKCNKGKP